MKKYIILLMVCIFAFANSYADIYTSVSKKIEIKKEKKEKAPLKLHWYGKAGINIGVTQGEIDNYHGIDFSTNTIGLDINAGFYSFLRPSNPSDFYWGADMSVGLNIFRLNDSSSSNGYYYCTAQNFIMPYLNLAPQLGWNKELSDTMKLNVHIEPAGMYLSSSPTYIYCYEDLYQYTDSYLFDSLLDGYSKIGVGFWYKNILYDISYRQPWVYYPGTITLGVGVKF